MRSKFKQSVLASALAALLTVCPPSEVQAVASTPFFEDSDHVACDSSSTGDRYCDTSGFYNEYNKFELEFMEGDTPQSMYGMWWKERCSKSLGASSCKPEMTCSGDSGQPMSTFDQSTYFSTSDYTFDNAGCYYPVTTPAVDFYKLKYSDNTEPNSMIRIRRIWQFPSYSATSPLPSDVYNHEAQVIYTSSDSNIATTNYGWMMGDVVPLNSCAYVVSQSTLISGSTLYVYYNFEQWVMSIKADEVLQQRSVQLRQNYYKQFEQTYTGSSCAIETIRDSEKVFWYPYWGAFYWVSVGRLILKIDNGFSTADADVVDPSLDPCQSDAPIFGCTGLSDTDCISHVYIDLGQGNCLDCKMIDHVWVFKFMYLAVNGNNPHYILKVYGNPRGGTLAYTNYMTSYSSSV